MTKTTLTLIWGFGMSVMFLIFGIRAVDVSATEIPTQEVVTATPQDMPEIQARMAADAFLTEKGVNVPEAVHFECEAAGRAFDVCPEILEALAWKESRFTVDARNGSCIGLMQMNEQVHGDRLALYGQDYYSIHSQVWAAASLLRDIALDNSTEGEPADIAYCLAVYHGEDCPESVSRYTETILEIAASLERVHGK